MYRKNFCYVMVPDKVVYLKNKWQNGHLSVIQTNHILDYMEVDASHAIFEVEVPYEWIGKTVGGLDIRRKI